MKVGDLVTFPQIGVGKINGIILEQGIDEDNGEKMFRVILGDGDVEWFYDGYLEVISESG